MPCGEEGGVLPDSPRLERHGVPLAKGLGLCADPGCKLVSERGEAADLGVECGDPALGDPGRPGAGARASVRREVVAFQEVQAVQAARAAADVSDGEAEAQQLADHAEAGHFPRAVDPLA